MKRRLPWVIGGLVVLAGVAGGVAWSLRGTPGSGDLARQLRDRGRVLVVGDRDHLAPLVGAGSEIVAPADASAVAAALEGSDAEALVDAMAADRVDALLVDGRSGGEPAPDASLGDRLAAYSYVDGLSAEYLTPAAALYLPADVGAIEPPLDEALATVARGILEGARPPRVSSFPEPLRQMRNVEVMVMLRDGARARLWRSARGSSIARALITAAVVAKQRWDEREQAMGGPLEERLPYMDLEVVLLEEDGTLGARSPAFIERAFTPRHGVAYERRAWRYLLPDATREVGGGSAVQAYAHLFAEHGLDEDSFQREDLRLYRLVARPLARSAAPSSSSGGSTLLEELGLDDDTGSSGLEGARSVELGGGAGSDATD